MSSLISYPTQRERQRSSRVITNYGSAHSKMKVKSENFYFNLFFAYLHERLIDLRCLKKYQPISAVNLEMFVDIRFEYLFIFCTKDTKLRVSVNLM